MATGYLGWSPDVAMSTPIPQIVLAYEYQIKKRHAESMGFSTTSHKPAPRNKVQKGLMNFASIFSARRGR